MQNIARKSARRKGEGVRFLGLGLGSTPEATFAVSKNRENWHSVEVRSVPVECRPLRRHEYNATILGGRRALEVAG